MKHSRKLLLWTTVIIVMTVAVHNVHQRIIRDEIATAIARARCATFTCDAFSLEKKPVSREVANMISEKIRNESSVLFLGRKSVVYGHIDLFDEDSVQSGDGVCERLETSSYQKRRAVWGVCLRDVFMLNYAA